jgi:hypothetical protein
MLDREDREGEDAKDLRSAIAKTSFSVDYVNPIDRCGVRVLERGKEMGQRGES